MFHQLNSNFCRSQKTERSCYTTLNYILSASLLIPSAASYCNTLNCTPEAKIFARSRPKFPTPYMRLLTQKIFDARTPSNFGASRAHSLTESEKHRAPHVKAATTRTTHATHAKAASSLKTLRVQHVKPAIRHFHNVQPPEKARSRAF